MFCHLLSEIYNEYFIDWLDASSKSVNDKFNKYFILMMFKTMFSFYFSFSISITAWSLQLFTLKVHAHRHTRSFAASTSPTLQRKSRIGIVLLLPDPRKMSHRTKRFTFRDAIRLRSRLQTCLHTTMPTLHGTLRASSYTLHDCSLRWMSSRFLLSTLSILSILSALSSLSSLRRTGNSLRTNVSTKRSKKEYLCLMTRCYIFWFFFFIIKYFKNFLNAFAYYTSSFV